MSITKATEWIVGYALTLDDDCIQDVADGHVTVLAKTPESALVLGRKVIAKIARRARQTDSEPSSFCVTSVSCGGDVYYE